MPVLADPNSRHSVVPMPEHSDRGPGRSIQGADPPMGIGDGGASPSPTNRGRAGDGGASLSQIAWGLSPGRSPIVGVCRAAAGPHFDTNSR